MEFISTRGGAPPTKLREALFQGLAPDGGLFMPREIPRLTPEALQEIAVLDWPDVALPVVRHLLGDSLPQEDLTRLTREALDFPLPMIRLREDIHVVELFRGPTLAFKDVGARFLARLLAHFRNEADPPLTVLTATSGDTGGAVAQAFLGLEQIRVVVLFPDGKVSPRQERQFSTLGGNVHALAVQGDFDDCQRLAKEAFEAEARGKGAGEEGRGARLTSANSINVGRFLPQTTYYFRILHRFKKETQNKKRILVSVPSGNFGNVAAGLLARFMRAKALSLLAATNRNDVVPELLRTGRFSPRPSFPTLSTAMDVGNPSNLDRILHLYGGSVEKLRRELVTESVSDADTLDGILRVHRETGYVLDPHSAVGFVALEREMERRPDSAGVLLATAHPAKFAGVVEPALGESLPLPPELSRSMAADRKVIPVEPRLEALKEVEVLRDLF